MLREDIENPDGTKDVWTSSCCHDALITIDGQDACFNCRRNLGEEKMPFC